MTSTQIRSQGSISNFSTLIITNRMHLKMALVPVRRGRVEKEHRQKAQGKATFGYNEWNRPSSPVKLIPPVVGIRRRANVIWKRSRALQMWVVIGRLIMRDNGTTLIGCRSKHSHLTFTTVPTLVFVVITEVCWVFVIFPRLFFSSPITVRFWTWFFLRKTWRIQYFLRTSVNLRRFLILVYKQKWC